MLEPFGVTPDDAVTITTAELDVVAALPVPGEEDLYGNWACSGELLGLYRRVGLTFEPVPFEPGYLNLTELQ